MAGESGVVCVCVCADLYDCFVNRKEPLSCSCWEGKWVAGSTAAIDGNAAGCLY